MYLCVYLKVSSVRVIHYHIIYIKKKKKKAQVRKVYRRRRWRRLFIAVLFRCTYTSRLEAVVMGRLFILLSIFSLFLFLYFPSISVFVHVILYTSASSPAGCLLRAISRAPFFSVLRSSTVTKKTVFLGDTKSNASPVLGQKHACTEIDIEI